MNCETVREMLWAYLEQEITAEETDKMEAHLASCAACREEMKVQKDIMDSLQNLPEEELPDGYHTELMQKLQAEAAPNVVPFPIKKKRQPVYKQWGMIAAAVMVVVAAGGMDGMLGMREAQNAAVQEMKSENTAESMAVSAKDMMAAEDSLGGTAEVQQDGSVTYQKMNAPTEKAPEAKGEDSRIMDSAAVPEATSMYMAEAEQGQPFIIRSVTAEATDRAVLLTSDETETMMQLQKIISEVNGFEENGTEGSITAGIPVENFERFIHSVEGIGTLNWTLQGEFEEGAAYRIVEIQLKTN